MPGRGGPDPGPGKDPGIAVPAENPAAGGGPERRCMSAAYPLLHGEDGDPDFPLGGRLITVGSARECSLHLLSKGIPERAGHLLFRAGSYQAQAAAPASGFKVNGKTAVEPVALRHGDSLEIGTHRFRYLEKPDSALEAPDTASAPWKEIAEALAQLLRDPHSDVFAGLVSGMSRLFRCDAARVVEEDP